MDDKLKVVITGIGGKMGRAMFSGLVREPDIEVVGGVDPRYPGEDMGTLAGLEPVNIFVSSDLQTVFNEKRPDIMLDFTKPDSAAENVRIALKNKVSCIIGTSGLSKFDLEQIEIDAKENDTPVLVVPNFALGAILMMRFAQETSRFFPHVEVVEMHHDQKLDAPSGTAMKTLEMMAQERKMVHQGAEGEEERIPGSRGGNYAGMRVHSVRLPGLIAHQEVIFGENGQVFMIRHDTLSRESFVPGVLLAIRNVKKLEGVVSGLENIMW